MNSKRIRFLIMSIPISGFLVFFTVPFIISVAYSFDNSGGGFSWNGLNNYSNLLNSSAFSLACINTFRFIVFGLPVMIVLSLSLALIFNSILKSRSSIFNILFSINLLPIVIPSSAIIFFINVLFENYGVINSVIVDLGGIPIDFFHSSAAFNILFILYIWKNYSYGMVIITAGLKSIDKSLYEAASLDGAGHIKKFRYLTLPALKPFLLFITIVGVIGVFRLFRESYLLFGSYPNKSIYMLQNFMNNSFVSFNYQQLSAASIIFFILISTFVIFIVKSNKKEQLI